MTAIRLASAGDAEAVLTVQHALDTESEFMLLEPGEREPHDLPGEPSYLIVAEGDDELAGYVEVSVLPYARAASSGYVVMGVRTAYAGRGIGKALLAAAKDEAAERGLRRLELTVMTHNTRALNLYLACGFEVEGLRRDALMVGGEIRSEYYMGLLVAERHPRA